MCILRISKETDYMVLTILLATEEYRICGYAKLTGSILDIGGMGALFGQILHKRRFICLHLSIKKSFLNSGH